MVGPGIAANSAYLPPASNARGLPRFLSSRFPIPPTSNVRRVKPAESRLDHQRAVSARVYFRFSNFCQRQSSLTPFLSRHVCARACVCKYTKSAGIPQEKKNFPSSFQEKNFTVTKIYKLTYERFLFPLLIDVSQNL